LKWTVEIAAREFGPSIPTLRKLLNKSGVVADKDGLYTTAQITTAIYDSLSVEKLLTQRQLRKKLELENAITEASVLNRAELAARLAAVADGMMARIRATSGLNRHEQDDLLNELASVPVVLNDVAARQSRLPRRGNGETAHDNVDDES
jgi:hypothetical protein